MTDATDHALEQAERIVQYAKYSDRFMVVEGDSAAERRAFVKLIGQKLPRQVRPVVVRADAGNGASALIEQLGTLLQLSTGIETFDQLITAATAALDGQDRLLIVVENADHWLDSDGADALFDLITQAHDLARERLLFLLVGANGLCERVETAQPLAGLMADLHCAQLLGATHTTEKPAPAASAPATEDAAATAGSAPTAAPTTRSKRSAWANPTLLIAGIISIAVVSIGAFALLGRSEAPAPEPAEQPVTLKEGETSDDAAQTASMSSGDEQPAETTVEHDASEATQAEKSASWVPALPQVDHGQPLFVPSPSATPAPSETAPTAETETTAPAEETTEAVSPVPPENQGVAAATPPADVDNDWYRDQPRARAAIQMAAFGKLTDAEALVERFAGEGRPREDWHTYTQLIDGRTLYTVTFGNFASTERARHAIDDLPAELKKLKPYPRSVGAIQDRLADASP